MPWVAKESSPDSAKVLAVQSLVGEQLLAREAERQGLGNTGLVAGMRASLRRALARDALYHQVVAGSEPSAAEVERIVRRRQAGGTYAEREKLRKAVADSLRQRSEQQRAHAFMVRLLAHQRAVADSSVFVLLADSLHAHMVATPEGRESAAGFAIEGEDVDALLSKLRPTLDRPLVRIGEERILLGDVLEDLRFYSFHVHSLDPQSFRIDLSRRLKAIVEGELLAREAIRRQLDQSEEVRRDLGMWTDAWRAQMLLERVAAGFDSLATPHASGRARPEDLRAVGRANRVARYVAALADRSDIRWNNAAVSRVDIIPSNMVTRRFLGFGGGMLAAPSLPPLWQWVPIWRESHKPLP